MYYFYTFPPELAFRIGAGTGIFTRALLNHPEWATSIGTLRAIEPSDGMRDFWMKRVQDNRCTIVNGTFDNTAVEDGWADLIIIAQASSFRLNKVQMLIPRSYRHSIGVLTMGRHSPSSLVS
jgi:hypothetical protein